MPAKAGGPKVEPTGELPQGGATAAAAQFSHEPATDQVRAWEEIETGRYLPRRIKGSCKGRALG
jgi:hypothetical protein